MPKEVQIAAIHDRSAALSIYFMYSAFCCAIKLAVLMLECWFRDSYFDPRGSCLFFSPSPTKTCCWGNVSFSSDYLIIFS